jgi:hypothetical protein
MLLRMNDGGRETLAGDVQMIYGNGDPTPTARGEVVTKDNPAERSDRRAGILTETDLRLRYLLAPS